MKNFMLVIVISILVLLTNQNADAAEELFIPLGTKGKPAKIITVSLGGGDFTDPVAAVNSITDASADKPYLVLIGPGVYTLNQTLQMKPYVSIAGSGQEATKLTGEIIGEGADATSALVIGANNVTLSELTIENKSLTKTGIYLIALYNNSNSPFIQNVTLIASGSEMSHTFGIYNTSASPIMSRINVNVDGAWSTGIQNMDSSPIITDLTVNASGETGSWGVYNGVSSPDLKNVTISVNGSGGCHGLVNSTSSSTTLTHASIISEASLESYGILSSSSSSIITDVNVIAKGGSPSYAVDNYLSSATIRHSTLNGETNGVNMIMSGTLRIMQSSISGGINHEAGTLTCVNSDDGVATKLGTDCLPVPP